MVITSSPCLIELQKRIELAHSFDLLSIKINHALTYDFERRVTARKSDDAMHWFHVTNSCPIIEQHFYSIRS